MTDPKNGQGGFKAFAQHEDADKTAADASASRDAKSASKTDAPATSKPAAVPTAATEGK